MWEATHYNTETKEPCVLLDSYKAKELHGRKLINDYEGGVCEFLVKYRDGRTEIIDMKKIGVI